MESSRWIHLNPTVSFKKSSRWATVYPDTRGTAPTWVCLGSIPKPSAWARRRVRAGQWAAQPDFFNFAGVHFAFVA